MTLHLGLIGNPISHSLSPTIQMAAYRELGLDWDYKLFPCVDAKAARTFVFDVRKPESGFLGLNVTTPYKAVAAELADLASPRVQTIASANVLAFLPRGCEAEASASQYLCAETTDGRAAVKVLEAAGAVWQDTRVVICGSGNVASSILIELVKLPVAEIIMFSRDPEGASASIQEQLSRFNAIEWRGEAEWEAEARGPEAGALHVRAAVTGMQDTGEVVTGPTAATGLQTEKLLAKVRVLAYTEAELILPDAKVLINATSSGMRPDDPPLFKPQLLHRDLNVLDLVYGHGQTQLLLAAHAAGAEAQDGLPLLIEQAALSIEYWASLLKMSLKAPRATMEAAARKRQKGDGNPWTTGAQFHTSTSCG
ncbi:MAG: hypothetical protein LBH87_03715 [Coriobacteriales bacterium]|jgi:shikimate dehydrogenase|nr:hypothetical protein [Coriobacteriales bacterium]